MSRLRRIVLPALLALGLAAPVQAHATVAAFGAGRRVVPGTLPAGGAPVLVLVAPHGGFAAGQIAVTGSGGTVAWDPSSSPDLVKRTKLFTVARTLVGTRRIADPLPPLRGGKLTKAGVLFLRVSTEDIAPGVYRGSLTIGPETMPVSLTVSAWSLPPRTEGFRTLFQIQPQSYFEAVDSLFPYRIARAANRYLFTLLSRYRIAPADWGYGTPGPSGYTNGSQWINRRASIMRIQARLGFNTLRLPLSTQHQVGGRWVGGASPYEPESWGGWLSTILPFWLENDYDNRAVAWAWDEPGPAQERLLASQARALHAAFPVAKLLSTLAPRPANLYLRDGGDDDVDVWAILSRRFYGILDYPRRYSVGVAQLRTAPAKEIWSYTYHGPAGSPGFDATEPLSDVRLFFAWNALEGTRGTLYSDGMVSYKGFDPWVTLPDDGQSVFIYPGTPHEPAPVSSLRLEAIRDGIQDANLFEAYAAAFGQGELLRLLSGNGLFAAQDGRLLLGCRRGCDRRTPTKFAFPIWQHDERRAAAGLERARTVALFALARLQTPPPPPPAPAPEPPVTTQGSPAPPAPPPGG